MAEVRFLNDQLCAAAVSRKHRLTLMLVGTHLPQIAGEASRIEPQKRDRLRDTTPPAPS